jgi:hypothetical protein
MMQDPNKLRILLEKYKDALERVAIGVGQISDATRSAERSVELRGVLAIDDVKDELETIRTEVEEIDTVLSDVGLGPDESDPCVPPVDTIPLPRV